MTAQSDEHDLLTRYASGDQSAARELTRRLVPGVHALAWRMLRDRAEAEDVAQEAMLRLWKIAPDWKDDGAKVSTWLYRVTNNLCIDRIRRRREMTGDDKVPDVADASPSVLSGMRKNERAEALNSALTTLPDRQRLAVVLRHIEEKSNPEVAEILDTSVEAVESLLSRARRSLASRLLPKRALLGITGEQER